MHDCQIISLLWDVMVFKKIVILIHQCFQEKTIAIMYLLEDYKLISLMKDFPFFFNLFVNMDLNWYMMISIVVNICFHCILGSKLSNFVYVPGHIEHILFEVFKVGKLNMLKIIVF